MRGACKTLPVPEHQADAYLSQTNPGDGTKYTILDTAKNVRIIGIFANCTWTVQPTPLEIHVTVDGQVYTFAQANPVSTTPYYPRMLSHVDEASQVMDTSEPVKGFLLEGRSVKVEAEITGGTVSNMKCRVRYAKW